MESRARIVLFPIKIKTRNPIISLFTVAAGFIFKLLKETKMAKAGKPIAGIIMGSDSDLKIMQAAAEILKYFEISYEITIVSAHRTPLRMVEYASSAVERGLKVIIAGAGGAAHLPGMIASLTIIPVVGVPIKSSNSIDGWDSVLSILQMPNGVPVATVALNAAKNAGILAAEMLAIGDGTLAKKLTTFKKEMREEVEQKAEKLTSDHAQTS
jgi:5-(carboxyamino)imidazole ribonucleotide mutase